MAVRWWTIIRVGVVLCIGVLCCCHAMHRHELRISVNPWVGFTPIAYAQQKGWLADCPVRLLWVVGLEENVTLYQQGLSDGFVATQYEYLKLANPKQLKPYALFDRSCGADVILSNRTMDQLRSVPSIDAYLEVTSLNQDLLEAFTVQHQLDLDAFVLHPADPEQLRELKALEAPAVIVAYEPYATAVERNGFSRIASTRTLDKIMVVDALWLAADLDQEQLAVIRQFKQAIDRAILQLQKDPEEYYQTVRGYLEGQSFDDFAASLNGIEWINQSRDARIYQNFQRYTIATDALL